MSILEAIGITISDQQSHQSELAQSSDQGMRNLYAAIIQRALHDLVRFRVFLNPSEDIKKEAMSAYLWFMGGQEGQEVSFETCCLVLGYKPESVLKGIEKQGLFLTDVELIPPPRKKRRFARLALVN